MEPLELGKFIVQILEHSYKRLTIVTECSKGYSIIKKRFGHPIKWRNKPCLYWKWPLIDTFDKVDMRKHYLQVNAHSFHSEDMHSTIVPYNIIIDVQVEYQVINPLVIYEEYGFGEGEDAYISYVNNTVQEIISKIIKKYGISLDYSQLEEELGESIDEYIKEPLQTTEVHDFDNPFCSYMRNRKGNSTKVVKTKDCISISLMGIKKN